MKHLETILELLRRQDVVEAITLKQTHERSDLIENLMHRQHGAEVGRALLNLPSADIAHLMEMLPPDKRLLVWRELDDDKAGLALSELTDGIQKSILQQTRSPRLLNILMTLDTDDLAEIAEWIPEQILAEVKESLESPDRHWLEDTLAYSDDSVGSLMEQDCLIVKDYQTINDAIEAVRQAEESPEQTDKLFVVNRARQLTGTISLISLLRNPGKALLLDVMQKDVIRFSASDKAEDAAQAFERYDLISAPVVDGRGRIKGRLVVEAVMDYVREFTESQALVREGLNPRSDLLGPVVEGAKERWPWLFVNLCTAFIASRFIGIFENTIQQLVALATLMPIVASMGGNTGNQTIALFIRALTLDQVYSGNLKFIISRELRISMLNGLIWGGILGLFTLFLYQNLLLSLVMMTAVVLNLFISATVGIIIPLTLHKRGKDPAMGSSVMLTFITDSLGFLIFLGLATLFLVQT